MNEQDGDQPKDHGYTAEAISVLEGLEPRRPWSLLATGEGSQALTPAVTKHIEQILELFPSVPFLTVHTADGEGMVTRDFPSGYTRQVDELLAAIFEQNPQITGITFPACDGQPAHTATPEHPFWSPRTKARAERVQSYLAAIKSERVSPPQLAPEEMQRRRKIVEEAHHSNLMAGTRRNRILDPIYEAFIQGEIELADILPAIRSLRESESEVGSATREPT